TFRRRRLPGNTQPKGRFCPAQITFRLLGQYATGERLGAFEEGLVIGQSERLERRVAAQAAGACDAAAGGVAGEQHREGAGAPEVRVHAAAIAIAAAGRVPGLGILREIKHAFGLWWENAWAADDARPQPGRGERDA